MATAVKKAHAASSSVHAVRRVSEPALLAFRAYQDNDANYRWEIVDGRGEILAQSGSFASMDDAERAARDVHESIRSAPFESLAAKSAAL